MSDELDRPVGKDVEPVSAEEFRGDTRASYDRLDGESEFEHALLRGYLDMGTKRSMRALADLVKVPRERLQAYAVRNSWVQRAADFDADVTRRALAELEGDGLEMRRRHAEAAKLTMQKALEAVEHVRPEFMQPRDIPVWIDIASKLERSSRGVGDAPKRVELTGAGGGPIEVANNLSADERRALLAAVQEQIAARIGAPELDDVIEGEIVEDGEE